MDDKTSQTTPERKKKLIVPDEALIKKLPYSNESVMKYICHHA
jgi:hypothetical protein